jgi:nicotinamide-nucleotide amidase
MTDDRLDALAQHIVSTASARGETLTTAESCTGGMVGAAITAIPGSSRMFERGHITYSNQAKIDLLGVSQATLDAHGAVSEQIAREMATGALTNAGADYAIAITGIAGPGGSDHKPEGRVCFALAHSSGITTQTMDFGPLGRQNVRFSATLHALQLVSDAMLA